MTRPADIRPRLVRALHARVHAMGMTDDDYRALLHGWGVESSVDLDVDQLRALMRSLGPQRRRTTGARFDIWQRRVLAAGCELMRSQGYPDTLDYVMGVACRMAGANLFARIPTDKLRAIYNAFKNRHRALTALDQQIAPTTQNPQP